MRVNNGGSIELAADDWELHPIQDTTDRKRISRTANHVLTENKSYSKWNTKIEDTLSIAENGCGDRLIFQNKGGEFLPSVYCWNHETGESVQVAKSILEAVRI